jgi:RsiW-degrading membrane proteinase PrsW (M82 family)
MFMRAVQVTAARRHRTIAGFLGGALGTAAMSLIMRRAKRAGWLEVIPPREISARVLNLLGLPAPSRRRRKLMGLVVHFAFGSGMGALYGRYSRRAPDLAPGVARAVGFSSLVWLVSYYGWVPLFDLLPLPHQLPLQHNAAMIAGTCLWGAFIGATVTLVDRACSSTMTARAS